MAKYTDTQTFPESGVYMETAPPALVVIDAGGGTVAIDVDLGDGTFVAIPDSPFSADTAFHLEVASGRFRFTPSGGATYGFEKRQA
ncbi:hypothetical protein ACFO5X_26130 [Seohaeicola nanhaiensis]|uniref:Uncharacterized protein n=1 Tax=Seohaeicola nanhaiensis TaxID=1387282 RepID=A0ABV9KPT6_9RHOB